MAIAARRVLTAQSVERNCAFSVFANVKYVFAQFVRGACRTRALAKYEQVGDYYTSVGDLRD